MNDAYDELDDIMPILQQQTNQDDDKQVEQILQEEDIVTIETFKNILEQDDIDEEMFNALCFEFQSIVSTYSVEFIRTIWNASPGIYFAWERRKKCDRMDFTEQFWLQKHPSLQDPSAENPFPSFAFRDHYRINRSTCRKHT